MIATEPPQSAKLPALDRRTLFKTGVLGVGLLGMESALRAATGGFSHGVASGEPGPDGVLLWTRFLGAQDTALTYELSRTLDFASIAGGGSVTASPQNDWCCKARAEGLEPGTWYYFRFVAPDGSVSDIGRTKTLPEGPTQKFRMAVFSCSNIGFGWFNAYAHAAEVNDFDCALHLGDYLYEYAPGTYPSAGETTAGRAVWPASELVELADYRARYAAYRSDPDLRRLHQVYPMISGWDDHETANDSWSGGAENHTPGTEGDWSVRKAAAARAYREWMPVSDEPWASYEIGDLATLFRLETRLTARAEQFSYGKILAGKTTPQDAMAALSAFRDGAWRDPARELLGTAQQDWLAAGIRNSTASGKRWQVLAQQVLMGSVSTASGLIDALPDDLPGYVRQRILAGALASEAGLPISMDAWDGYPAARERVLRAALEANANLVSLAGDTHNAWAFDLDLDGEPVGVEFGGQSVSSPGFETYLPFLKPGDVEAATVGRNPQLRWMDSSRRGYMAVELTPDDATSEFRFVGSVKERGSGVVASKRISSPHGTRVLDLG